MISKTTLLYSTLHSSFLPSIAHDAVHRVPYHSMCHYLQQSQTQCLLTSHIPHPNPPQPFFFMCTCVCFFLLSSSVTARLPQIHSLPLLVPLPRRGAQRPIEPALTGHLCKATRIIIAPTPHKALKT